MDATQLNILFDDYLEDLQPYPAEMINQACKQYRLTPGNKFFPLSGELMPLVKAIWWPVFKKKQTIKKLLDRIPDSHRIEPPRPTDDDWAALKAELNSIPEPIPHTMDLPIPDRTYFDSKKPKQQEVAHVE